MIKKNCLNCEELEWAFGDVGDPEGFICNRKDWSNPKEEKDMLDKMNRDSYLEKSKKCFVVKTNENKILTEELKGCELISTMRN